MSAFLIGSVSSAKRKGIYRKKCVSTDKDLGQLEHKPKPRNTSMNSLFGLKNQMPVEIIYN